jgi:hypothetical protein
MGSAPLDTATSLATYWYFHLPNFVLAALMYTMLGRALLGLMVDADSPNYIWRFFCRITDPFIALVARVTPKATAPVVVWLFSFVWLFWLRVALHYTLLLLNLAPRAAGMINGIFNQLALVFALLYVQPLAGPLLFGSVPLTLLFASLMVSTATVILGGIPAAIYERLTAASDSNDISLWIWLAGTALLALPAIGNFFALGL